MNLQLQQVLWPGGLSKSHNGVNSELLNILMDINKFFPHSPVARAFVMSSWGASKSQKRKCDTRSACAATPGACPSGGGSLKDNEHAKEEVGTPAQDQSTTGLS